jgi:hypothetical protein
LSVGKRRVLQFSHWSCCGSSSRGAPTCDPTKPSMKAAASSRFAVGTCVTVADDYAAHSDAKAGPLSPSRTGVVLIDDGSESKPYKVKCSTSGREFWYDAAALRRSDGVRIASIPLCLLR